MLRMADEVAKNIKSSSRSAPEYLHCANSEKERTIKTLQQYAKRKANIDHERRKSIWAIISHENHEKNIM